MRISSGQGVAQGALQSDVLPSRLSAGERVQVYQRVFGAPGGGSGDVRPNREFEDLWLRFLSSVAQLERQGAPVPNPRSNPPSVSRESVGAAARELAAKAGPLVGAALATRDEWQVIDQVSNSELVGAVNRARHRTMAQAGGAILEWLVRHGAGADPAEGAAESLLDAVDQWLAVSGVPDADVDALSQPKETAQRLTAWSQYLHQAVGLDDSDSAGGGELAPRTAALFSGPPGTGKTLAAHWLATSLGLDLYRVDLGQLVSKYIGETEKNLEAVFRHAEQSRTVLVFDEADALFGKRTDVKDAHDRYASVEVNYLLQRMESFAGLTILTTNSGDRIDPDVLKRLKVVAFPIPPRD